MASIALAPSELDIVKRILRENLATGVTVLAFGSRVRGTHRATSDLDLAISSEVPLDMATRSKLEFGFSESDLPFRVDVVDLSTAEPQFAALIKQEGVPVR